MLLRAALVLVAAVVLGALLWEPHLEGRNVNASLFATYFKDPFLAFVYVSSVPFFLALYKTFKLLGYTGRNELFSQPALDAVRVVKYCAFITAGAIVAALAYIAVAAQNSGDDPAGAVALGVVGILISAGTGVVAAVVQQTVQGSVKVKSPRSS